MVQENASRRLAAVLAADVVGYSRLMSADEVGTLAALKQHRDAIFNPAVAEHNGRVVKLIGDGTLCEFASVVDAVRCALAIQRKVKAEVPQNGTGIVLRIGVNLGDVIIDGSDIYGDGVNVAARLEPLADPGGVCVASIVNESVGARVGIVFRDGGEVNVKNIDRPIRIWKWHPDHDPKASAAAPGGGANAPEATAPQGQSIAVLPFTNMSGDPEQEYFSDGITEDLITDLSKIGGLLVIARNSSFTYKGKNVDIRSVGRDLGVRSVLEGSIRRAGNRVRITAQLIDASTGGHLWADRYDRDLTDIFEVQDEVTRRIVEALRITLTPKEEALLEENTVRNLEAHDLIMKGRQVMLSSGMNREKFEKVIDLFDRGLALDPRHAEALAGLALAHLFDYNNRFTEDSAAALGRAVEYATRATQVDPQEPLGWLAVALSTGFSKDEKRSQGAIEKALAINPNFAPALNSRGSFNVYAGNAQEAIPDIERAMRLDPGFAQQYLHFLGLAHLLLGNYETAAMMFRERILLFPETDASRVMLAAALGHLGQHDDARAVWAELMQINPNYNFDQHMARLPFKRAQEPDTIRAGLTKAGLLGGAHQRGQTPH
jgi:adenylate cyclase